MKDLIIRIIAKLTGKGFKEAEDGFVRVSERAKDAFKGVGGLIGKFGKEFIRGRLWEVGAGAAMWGVRKLQDALEQAKRAEEELIAATERWNRKLADLGRNIRINKIAVDLAQVKKHLDGVASGDISEAEHQARLNAIIRSRATGSDAARAIVANTRCCRLSFQPEPVFLCRFFP